VGTGNSPYQILFGKVEEMLEAGVIGPIKDDVIVDVNDDVGTGIFGILLFATL
jgi:hypothetical protein